ncbi:hypothetical protein ACTXT7_005121 [Hymenolepis weldensis]
MKVVFNQTGTEYIRGPRQQHFEGTVESTLFDFKHAKFSCARHGAGIRRGSRKHRPTGCTARFTATSTGGCLRILKYDMLHNHSPEPITEDFKQSILSLNSSSDQTLNAVATGLGDEFFVSDLTKEFLDIFENRFFYSCQALIDCMNRFMKSTGSNYVLRNTVRFPDDHPLANRLVYRSLAFECYHYGTYTSYATVRRKQKTTKIGCQSKIYFCCKDDQLQIGKYQLKHNHEVNPENPFSELKIPDGKSRKRKATYAEDNVEIIEHYLPEDYGEEYKVNTFPENDEWIESDQYPPNLAAEVSIQSSNQSLDHIFKDVMSCQLLGRSLSNLRAIAYSDGPDRFFTCLHDLQELENKWKAEFCLDGEVKEEAQLGNSGDFPGEEIEFSSPPLLKRLSIVYASSSSQRNDLLDIPQSSNFDDPQNRSWHFCEET